MRASATGLLFLGGIALASAASPTDVGIELLPLPAGYNISQMIGRTGIHLSRNGRFVAATLSTVDSYQGLYQAVKWNVNSKARTQLTFSAPGLNATQGYVGGISADGSFVSGNIISDQGYVLPILWNGTAGTPLNLPGNNSGADAGGVSDDGTMVVGRLLDSGGFRLFRWKAAGTIVSNPIPNYSPMAMPMAVSKDGRYMITTSASSPWGSNEPSAIRYDFTTGTSEVIRGPEGSRVGVEAYDISANGKTVVGSAFGYPNGQIAVQSLAPEIFKPMRLLASGNHYSAISRCVSQDGAIIVGRDGGAVAYHPNIYAGWFVWTKTRGTRSLEEVLGEQGIRIPAGMAFTTPYDVTVTDGVVKIVGLADYQGKTNQPVLVTFEETTAPGVPVNLNGIYRAAKHASVWATTDPQGIGTDGQVREPSIEGNSTPFSDFLRRPTPMQCIALRNKGFQFDVDLGDPANWPTPSSTLEFGAGNAAEGKQGTSFVIRLADSAGNSPMNLANNNGLRIAFYRRDGRFWGHLKNQWYNQDLDIPISGGGTRYRVNVEMNESGAMVLTITLANGTGRGNKLTFNIAGGSSDYLGTTSFSFMAELINRTTLPTTLPTEVRLSGFATTAVPDAMLAWTDTPYRKANQRAIFRLNAANLTAPIGGYQTDMFTQFGGGAMMFALGVYETLDYFNSPTGSFGPNNVGRIIFGNSGGTPLSASDRNLALMPRFAFGPGTGVFDFTPAGQDGTAFFKKAGNVAILPKLVTSNVAVADLLAPELAVTLTQNCATNPSPMTAGIVMIAATAVDQAPNVPNSGLETNPTYSVDMGNDGTFEWENVPLNSANPAANGYSGAFNIPDGATSVRFVFNATDRAGNVTTVSVVRSISAGLLLTATLSGVQTDTPINRTMRIVLGGNPGSTAGALAPIVINKVITFVDPDGSAGPASAIGTYVVSNVPNPVNPKMKLAYMKDPYHTLGASVATKIVSGRYAPLALTLIPGDLNNDNFVDNADLNGYYAKANTTPGANTALLTNSTALLLLTEFHADLSGDGRVGIEDFNLIWPSNQVRGATEPGKFAP